MQCPQQQQQLHWCATRLPSLSDEDLFGSVAADATAPIRGPLAAAADLAKVLQGDAAGRITLHLRDAADAEDAVHCGDEGGLLDDIQDDGRLDAWTSDMGASLQAVAVSPTRSWSSGSSPTAATVAPTRSNRVGLAGALGLVGDKAGAPTVRSPFPVSSSLLRRPEALSTGDDDEEPPAADEPTARVAVVVEELLSSVSADLSSAGQSDMTATSSSDDVAGDDDGVEDELLPGEADRVSESFFERKVKDVNEKAAQKIKAASKGDANTSSENATVEVEEELVGHKMPSTKKILSTRTS